MIINDFLICINANSLILCFKVFAWFIIIIKQINNFIIETELQRDKVLITMFVKHYIYIKDINLTIT